MKTSQQIIGLPVVSITDGNEIGRVKALMIHAAMGKADFLILDSAIRSLAGGVVPIGKVLGIGTDAVTVLQAEDVSAMADVPAAIELLQKNATVRGTRILSRKGTLLGVAGDLIVDEDNACLIAGVGFIPGNEDREAGILPREAIITFGGNLLVVEENALERLVSADLLTGCGTGHVEPALAGTAAPEPPTVSPDQPAVSANQLDAPPSDQRTAEESELSVDGLFGEDSMPRETETLMADRRIQYLRGRRVTRDILGPDAGLVAKAGDIIDDVLMERANKAGCLVELVMNNEA